MSQEAPHPQPLSPAGREEILSSPLPAGERAASGTAVRRVRGSSTSPRFALHLIIFLVFLGLWTWKLLEPVPVPPQLAGGLSGQMRLILAKCLHLGGYTFLTVLALTLPAPRRCQIFLLVLLILHAAGSEYGQSLVPNRTGKVTDVLLDWFGIGLGVFAVRWWRRR